MRSLLRRNRPFLIALALCWVGIVVLYLYLESQCRANPACSGEYGIALVMLGLPWILLFPGDAAVVLAPAAVLLNTVLFGGAVQTVVRFVQRARRPSSQVR